VLNTFVALHRSLVGCSIGPIAARCSASNLSIEFALELPRPFFFVAAMPASASWESWDAAPSWASVGQQGDAEDSDDELDLSTVAPDVAGEFFSDLLVDLKCRGLLNATHACVLAFWAHKAGAQGPASSLAFPPGNPNTGAYSRHFDAATGAGTKGMNFYPLPLGRRPKFDAMRRFDSVPCRLPHELLLEELQANGRALEELEQALANHDLPDKYYAHPVVRANPGVRVHPFTLYIDGVQYTRRDTVLGVWVYFSLTERRRLLFTVRKSECCTCGCKSWCTIRPMFEMLAWSCEAMLRGVHPVLQHDGQPWDAASESGRVRASLAGSPLGFIAVCLIFKCDWAEVVRTFGFPQWNDVLHPCPWCLAPLECLNDVRGYSPLGMPAPTTTAEVYEAGVTACELTVALSAAAMKQVRAALVFDKKKDGGARGRALAIDLPALGLSRGLRLEPTAEFPDIANFHAGQWPRTVTFWDRQKETVTRQRNPLFNTRRTGITVTDLGIDWLHALSLGVFQVIVGLFLRELLDANAWRVAGGTGGKLELGVARLKGEMDLWYSEEERQGRYVTRVQDLVASMIGPRSDPGVSLHASETNHLLRFAHSVLLPKYGHVLGDRLVPFRTAIDDVICILDIIKAHPNRVPPRDVQVWCDRAMSHIRAIKALGVRPKPKHHQMLEMGPRLLVRLSTTPSVV
jgi:hypothetical protein